MVGALLGIFSMKLIQSAACLFGWKLLTLCMHVHSFNLPVLFLKCVSGFIQTDFPLKIRKTLIYQTDECLKIRAV